MTVLDLHPGGPPAGINMEVPSIVRNVDGSEAIYSDTAEPFTVQGTLPVGAEALLRGTFFFRVAMVTRISISPAPDPLEARVAALEQASP